LIESDLVAFAAGSLVDAFGKIGGHSEAEHPGARVHVMFARADHLRQRLSDGERADVFAPAKVYELDLAREGGLLAEPTLIFAQSRLRIIVAASSSDRVGGLADLARPGIRLATEHAGAPRSRYTRGLLACTGRDPRFGPGFAVRVAARAAVRVATVRELVARVADGSADAGIVYAPDVTADVGDQIREVAIPHDLNVVANYAIATVTHAENRSGGASFVSLVRCSVGQAMLARRGFLPVGQVDSSDSDKEQRR
jgi:molybdate transport system substrate-binding protein